MRSFHLVFVAIYGLACGCAASTGLQGAARASDPEGQAPSRSGGTRGATVEPEPGSRADELRLAVEAMVTSDGSAARVLREGAEARSGDRVTASVTATQDAWVYLLGTDANGQTAVLYPTDGNAMRVPAGVRVRVPPPGRTLRLDDHTGAERLYVVASRRPLAESDAELHEVIEHLRAPSQPVPTTITGPTTEPAQGGPPVRRQPPPVTIPEGHPPVPSTPSPPIAPVNDPLAGHRLRGVHLEDEATSRDDVLRLKADEDGVVFWQITFRHVP